MRNQCVTGVFPTESGPPEGKKEIPAPAATGTGTKEKYKHLRVYGISPLQAIAIRRWKVDANLLVEVLA